MSDVNTNSIVYKVRCWLYAKLWILSTIVAPENVRALNNKAMDIGIKQLEKENNW